MPQKSEKLSLKAERDLWLDEEVRPLLQGKALATPVEEMTLSEITEAWQVLSLLKSNIEARLKGMHDILMGAAERDGTPTDTGGAQLFLNGAKLELQRRQASEPTQKETLALLGQRKIELSEAYDEVKALVFNASKAAFLIDTGKLSAEEVDALKPVSYALRIYKSEEVVEAYEAAAKPKRTRFPASRSAR